MNWRAFDLNLLVVFDGVFREGSVTRAGKILGMRRPALKPRSEPPAVSA